MTGNLFEYLIIYLLVSLLIFSIVMIIVTSIIKNNKRIPDSLPKSSDYEMGYSDAVNKVIDILSVDPAHKEIIKFIVWQLKL